MASDDLECSASNYMDYLCGAFMVPYVTHELSTFILWKINVKKKKNQIKHGKQ